MLTTHFIPLVNLGIPNIEMTSDCYLCDVITYYIVLLYYVVILFVYVTFPSTDLNLFLFLDKLYMRVETYYMRRTKVYFKRIYSVAELSNNLNTVPKYIVLVNNLFAI
jgi:hypothetical protein